MNGQPKLVSVIIPTFNRPGLLGVALNSALRQTYTALEIIVTDDSTNYMTSECIKTICDDRVRYYKNDNTLGIAANTRKGISLSTGEYFCFLNDDDYWQEDFIERMMAIASGHTIAGCIFCDHWLVDSKGEILIDRTDLNTIIYKRNTLTQGLIPPNKRINLFLDFSVPVAMACMIKRQFIDIENYPLDIGGAYDRWILLQCIKNDQCSFIYLNNRLTYYRVHNASVSSTHSTSVVKSVIFILNKAKLILPLNDKQKSQINKGLRSYIKNLVSHGTIKVSYLFMYFRTYFL